MYQVSLYNLNGSKNYSTIQSSEDSPYKAIEGILKTGTELQPTASVLSETKLAELLPIHNPTGIRDPKQINQMKNIIDSGQDIFHDNGLPNIKLVVAPNSKLLLFDGHHTALAYLAAGKEFLNEVPHVIFSGSNFSPIPAETVTHFFPKSDRNTVAEGWDKYTVNWQVDSSNQTELREVTSLGELFALLSKRYKSSS